MFLTIEAIVEVIQSAKYCLMSRDHFCNFNVSPAICTNCVKL